MKQIDFGEKVHRRRIELGLAPQEVARSAGISEHEYIFHIESDADSLTTVSPLREVKALCCVLRADLFWLLDLPCLFCDSVIGFRDEYKLPRNKLIVEERKRREWSRADLGDRINFLEPGIAKLEDDESEIENWTLENLEKVAIALDIPFQVLLGACCSRCGR